MAVRALAVVWLTLIAAAWPGTASAGGGPLCPAPPPARSVDVAAPERSGATRAAADRAEVDGEVTTLEGDVGIRRGARTLGADRIVYQRARGRARAGGALFLNTPDYEVEAERGAFDLDSGAFTVEGARYRVPSVPMQGRAQRIRRDARAVSELDGATWSTCPRMQQDWHIAATRVTLDPNTRQGTARNASLWFKGMPLFYSPWFRFPLGSERMTGFLAPTVGSSSSSGAEVAVPFYWNIAPQFDATLTPRWLERRGGQLQSQWRWLGPLGRWQIDNAYLPDDDLTGEDRVLTRLQHSARFGRWRTRIDAEDASDPDYFEDLGNDLSVSSQTHLRRRGDLNWSAARTRFRARVEDYQTLDETLAPDQRPYARLPQITLEHERALGPLDTGIDTELVRFDRDASTTAERLRIVPEATWPLEAPGWFLRPRLALDHTSYRIDRVTNAGAAERVDRTVPITSVDSGLVFDRFGTAYQQTLEPRLFYTYIPERDQTAIPVFDSGRLGFTFSQLFRERRFTGGDRIGDTNQATLALTSRVLDRSSGREVFNASVGVIRFFDEREVTLAQSRPAEPQDRDSSDVLAEITATPTPQWRLQASAQWVTEADRLAERDVGIQYRGDGGGVLNLRHRFKFDRQRQIDASAAWPITPQWRLLAASNWSLRDDRNIESLAGLQYDSCCWRLRVVARQFLEQDDSASEGTDQTNNLFIELTLKGLGPVGDDAGALLDRAIVGFDPSTP